jgi:hypothetical protein
MGPGTIANPPSRCADATKIILILTLRRQLHSNRQDRSILVGLTSLYIVGLCNVLSSDTGPDSLPALIEKINDGRTDSLIKQRYIYVKYDTEANIFHPTCD